MDISGRKSLLVTINKAASRESAKETARQIREPFRAMTHKDRVERLKGIRDSLRSSKGRMTYTPEQTQKLQSYQDLFDNWDKYKEYVNKPMQDIGDWVAEKTVVPAVNAGVNLYQGAKKYLGDEASVPSRDKAIKELENASKGSSLNDLVKNGIDIYDLQCFEQTYSALNSAQFHKIASGKIIAEDISSAFRKEIKASPQLYHQNFSEEYSDNLGLDLDTYNKFYELAVAHHVLTQEGHYKDASIIDNFVEKNPSIWGLKKIALWSAVKNVISQGFGLLKGVLAKGWKFIVSKLPILGIFFSVPFMIKNLIEAYHNGKRIISDLDLPKFGFNRMVCMTPAGLPHVRKTYRAAVDKYIKDPDALKELITIFRTIGAFWVDAFYAITNGLMAVLDIIAIGGLFFPGVGWLVSVGAMGADWLLGIGVAALEVSAEYFKDHYWDKDAAYMLEEAKKAVKELLAQGTAVKTEAPEVGSSFALPEDEDLPVEPASAPAPSPLKRPSSAISFGPPTSILDPKATPTLLPNPI